MRTFRNVAAPLGFGAVVYWALAAFLPADEMYPSVSCATAEIAPPTYDANLTVRSNVDSILADRPNDPNASESGGLRLAVSHDSELRIRGWAFGTKLGAQSGSDIVSSLNGKWYRGTSGIDRPDVAKAFKNDLAEHSGFCIRITAPPSTGNFVLRLFDLDREGHGSLVSSEVVSVAGPVSKP